MSFRRTLAAPLLTLASKDAIDLALHARVRVPNGRFGNVIGFYRGPEEESVGDTEDGCIVVRRAGD